MNPDNGFVHPVWIQAWERDAQYRGASPHGWIQWKGTDACVDLHCECGAHAHFDGHFLYMWECASCGARYAVGQNIKLIKLTDAEIESTLRDGHQFHIGDGDES